MHRADVGGRDAGRSGCGAGAVNAVVEDPAVRVVAVVVVGSRRRCSSGSSNSSSHNSSKCQSGSHTSNCGDGSIPAHYRHAKSI